jgi:hypothetical protein
LAQFLTNGPMLRGSDGDGTEFCERHHHHTPSPRPLHIFNLILQSWPTWVSGQSAVVVVSPPWHRSIRNCHCVSSLLSALTLDTDRILTESILANLPTSREQSGSTWVFQSSTRTPAEVKRLTAKDFLKVIIFSCHPCSSCPRPSDHPRNTRTRT